MRSPNDFRREPGGARDAVDDFFDDQHPLRSAEAAKGGVRREIGFRDPTAEFDVRNVVGVIEMEDRAVRHRARKIERPAAIGKELDLRREQQPVAVEADLEFPEERMAFAGDHHVLIAIEADAHFAARFRRGERRQRREHRRLRFLAAEPAAHARAFHHHAVHRQREHVRDDVLHLRRMLRRGADEHRAVFAALRPGRVRLEIKMVLTAKGEFVLERLGRTR